MKKNKLLVIPILLVLLCGCENKECVKSHEEEDTCFYYIYHKIGSVTIMTPIYYQCTKTVCDEYEGE